MCCWKILIPLVLICSAAGAMESRLPLSTIFRGQDQFNRLVAEAKSENWAALPIGERTAAVGQALVGTRYKHFTLEIDNRIESPSVNFQGMDCWTFFEIALGFGRMLNERESSRNYAAAMSSESFRGTEMDFIRPHTSGWRSAPMTAFFISCTPLHREIPAASSWTHSLRNICIAIGQTAESWSRARCVRFIPARGIPLATSLVVQGPLPHRRRVLRVWPSRRNQG